MVIPAGPAEITFSFHIHIIHTLYAFASCIFRVCFVFYTIAYEAYTRHA